jgi:UDP-GlcNAc:undecaprenyl-phosphate/decaprenyl-phosphate GlcNAc-1-phosphate transferase
MTLYPLLATLLAAIAMPLCIRMARRYRLYDRPDELRKVHGRSTPLTGGYGIILAFAIAATVQWLVEGPGFFSGHYPSIVPMYLYVAEATVIIVVLGVVDDLRDLTYAQKFFFQFIAAFLIILGAVRSHIFPQVFGLEDAGVFVNSAGMVVSLLWLVGTTNAINMIDGMDGLAGGTSLISAVAMAVVAFLWGNAVLGSLLLILAGAIAGFLFFNMPPARVFMGDGGSMFIGFVLAVCGWLLVDSGPDSFISTLVPIIILWLPVSDTLLAFFRRIVRGKNPFSADLHHIHHMLRGRHGLSLRANVLVLCCLALLYGGAGVAVAVFPARIGWPLIGGLVLAQVFFLHHVGYSELIMRRRVDLRPVPVPAPLNGSNGSGHGKNGTNGNGTNGHGAPAVPRRKELPAA